jgi:hypothetical protein
VTVDTTAEEAEIDYYSTFGSLDLSGPEYIFEYAATADGLLRFDYTSEFDGCALIVLPDDCSSTTEATGYVCGGTFGVPVTSDTTYFLLVEGQDGASGTTEFAMTCLTEVSTECCEVTEGVAGCGDADIEDCVCAVDSYCCDTEWDAICVDEVESLACAYCG